MQQSQKEIRLLGMADLESPRWEKQREASLARARGEDQGNEPAEYVAQETLFQLIRDIGGVREDVYEYLMTPRFRSIEAVRVVGELLCYAAPPEWLALSAEALKRSMGPMYVNEITEAYQAGIPISEVKAFLEKSNTVFEMCQYRRKYKTEELPDMMTGSEKEELPDSVTESEKEELPDMMAESDNDMQSEHVAKMITDAVMTTLQAMKLSEKEKAGTAGRAAANEEVELPDSMTGSRTEELPDSMAGSLAEAVPSRTWEEEEPAETGDAEFPGEEPEFSDGSEIVDNHILVTELKKEEEKLGKRISFFQYLLSRHMRRAFEKLEPEAQVGKIFEIMVEKGYGKRKVLAIRQLMKGGMTNEFVFALLEKDLTEAELEDLCETLIDKEAGARPAHELSEMPENETEEYV